MNKILQRLKNELLNNGLDSESYTLDIPSFRMENRKVQMGLIQLMLLVFIILSVLSHGILDHLSLYSGMFLLVFAVAAVELVIVYFDKKGKLTGAFCVFFRIFMYFYGLAMTLYVNPSEPTICLFVFLIMAPVLFYARFVQILMEIICTNVFFYLFGGYMKPLATFESDKTWIVVYSIAGVTISMLSLRIKSKGIDNARLMKLQTEELKEAYKKAEAASKAKSEFLSNISHEIRTPINAVLGLDEMICRETTEENIRDYANDIKSSGKTLLSLINDLLDESRLEAGKVEIIPEEYNIADTIHDLYNMISVRADQKNLEFKMDIDENLPKKLVGDESRIKQCITNILTNSVKYTEKGSVLFKVGFTKKDEDHITLYISAKDTGIGLREEDIDRLFKPFERIEEKRNMKVEGTGLGMAITQNLLLLMNSELKVNSVYGEGSDFYFYVDQEVKDWSPIGNYSEAAKESKKEVKKYKSRFKAPEARILVVDDTPMNLKVFAGLLRQSQAVVDKANSGMEALEMVAENEYDMIFLDHMMPEMDGIETLQEMKKRNVKAPIVALTANVFNGCRDKYMSYGFSDYLAKPINIRDLEEVLINFIPKEKIIETE